MAAIDTPWIASMSSSSTYKKDDGSSTPQPTYDPNPPTIAAFSPQTLSGSSIASKQRSTIIVHKKSPLLAATPPQVTRSLAFSHPFILPLNKLAGLLSWSSGDPWESFLLVVGFWAIALYGNEIILWAGPIIVVVGLIVAMYSRRYSPLSSTSKTGEKHGHKREPSESSAPQHKSLDEIVETLREFTKRCELLLDPFLRLTDFLSTQRTPTSATTRPALTALFIRILFITPVWILLTLRPFYIITTRRVILTIGTLALTWHSRPARVSRVILWRSLTVRRICTFITGLSFADQKITEDGKVAPVLPPRPGTKSQANVATDIAKKRRPSPSGVRFTFILYENERRWLGIGWTKSMLAYERAAWTDEHLNPAPSKDEFQLPYIEGAGARWRWIERSRWNVEGGTANTSSSKPASVKSGKGPDHGEIKDSDGGGWIYYDSKWNDGRRLDGWGRYTRRRKWYRDAELVEITPSTEITPSSTPRLGAGNATETTYQSETEALSPDRSAKKPTPSTHDGANDPPSTPNTQKDKSDSSSVTSATKAVNRKSWFGSTSSSTSKAPRPRQESSTTNQEGRPVSEKAKSTDTKISSGSGGSGQSRDEEGELDHHDQWRNGRGIEGWGVGDDATMGLS